MPQRLDFLKVAPEGVAALQGVAAYLQQSGLDRRLLTLVEVRVSQINGCEYCLHMHTEEARKLGEKDVRIFLLDAWDESQLFSEKERAALDWAEALTDIRHTRAPDHIYENARRHFSEKELTNLSIGIAMINAWNRLAIGARATHPNDLKAAA